MKKMKKMILSAGLIGIAGFMAAHAQAGVMMTTGALSVTAPPASFAEGSTESSTGFVILDEGVKVLPSDVTVNAFGVGVFTGSTAMLATLPKDSLVQTYFVHFDPVGSMFATVTGAVFFDPGQIILGIQTHTPLIDSTDLLGHPTPTYPTGFSTRGFETLPGTDTVTIAPGLGSASFTFFAELGIDQARIFTTPSAIPVPAPGAAAFMLLLTFGLARTAGMRSSRRV